MTEMTVIVAWRKGETSIYSFRSFGKLTFKKICEHLEKNMGFDPDFDTVTVSGKASIITLEA